MWFRGTKPRRPKPRPAARCNGPPEVTSAFRRARGRMAASRAGGKFAHSAPPGAGFMTQLLLFNVTNGLIIGAFYVLMALGLSLILNLSNVINFAHGGFLVIGGFFRYIITPPVCLFGGPPLAPPLPAGLRPPRRPRAFRP